MRILAITQRVKCAWERVFVNVFESPVQQRCLERKVTTARAVPLYTGRPSTQNLYVKWILGFQNKCHKIIRELPSTKLFHPVTYHRRHRRDGETTWNQCVKTSFGLTGILPIFVAYGFEIWSLTLREEKRLRETGIRMLFEPKKMHTGKLHTHRQILLQWSNQGELDGQGM